ncbi:MAG: adenylosuccinate lyase [Synergistaceae bacterium]|nr:adenylosuccinate lyase [Synergistaceae bacterium]
MIGRYEVPEIQALWSEESKFRTWLEVELAVCGVWKERGVIPTHAYEDIRARASFDIRRIDEIEQEVQHDMIAFVSSVAETVGENGRYIHLGLTSSDVIDTASSLTLKRSLAVVDGKVALLMKAVGKKAHEFRHVPCTGRTHGVHAEPTTFGLQLLNWHSQLSRDRERLSLATEQIGYGKISGAVGTYAHCEPSIERRVCELLGLKPALVSTQILQRDRHGNVMNTLALLGGALERFATEIRHLQRTEVMEALEPFGSRQKGSSAMPHKRNPILCERICGMSRLLRGYALTAMENMALWHERDISHSSAERVIWPDAFHVAVYMLNKMIYIVENMQVNTEKMKENLEITRGLVYSQRILLDLVERFGLSREEAYAIVQENAMACWKGQKPFSELLMEDERVRSRISSEELAELFEPEYYLRWADEIFSRFSLDLDTK